MYLRLDGAAAFEFVACDLLRVGPQRAAAHGALGEGEAGERELADLAALVEDHVAEVGAAPDFPIGAGTRHHDMGDVALAFFGLFGRTAFEIDRKREAIEIGLCGDVAVAPHRVAERHLLLLERRVMRLRGRAGPDCGDGSQYKTKRCSLDLHVSPQMSCRKIDSFNGDANGPPSRLLDSQCKCGARRANG